MSNQASYRIDLEPVLDVVFVDNTRDRVSLVELFRRAHEIVRVRTATVPGEFAWMRVLTALAYRVAALDAADLSVDEWRTSRDAAWSRGRFEPEDVEDYFARWGHRFDLFDAERPWMQDPRLVVDCDPVKGPKCVNAIIPERPQGNNPVFGSLLHPLVDDDSVLALDPARAAEYLLVDFMMASSGTTGTRTLRSTTGGKDTVVSRRGSGPLRNAVVHYASGRTLFESLIGSLVPPIIVAGRDAVKLRATHPDLPLWERAELPPTEEAWPVGVFDLLASWTPVATLLVPTVSDNGEIHVKRVYSTLRYAKGAGADPVTAIDPWVAYVKREKGVHSVKVSATNSNGWHHLVTLLSNPEEGEIRPKVADEIETLPTKTSNHVVITAGGLESGSNPASLVDVMRCTTPPLYPNYWVDDEHNSGERYRAAMGAWARSATRGSNQIFACFKAALSDMHPALKKKGKAKKLNEQVAAIAAVPQQRYWARIRADFYEALLGSASLEEFEELAEKSRFIAASAAREEYDTAVRARSDLRSSPHTARNRPRVPSRDKVSP